jgi:hypothetical protein
VIYRWKSGAHVPKGASAQVVGERLESLRQEHGGLTARVVVDDARDKSSVLHPAFEWNDKRAAEHWRLEQARHLIAAVTVVRDDTAAAEPIRAFVVVKDDEGDQSYESVTVALADPSKRAQVLSRARRELEAWRDRYAELEEFAAVFSAIDSAAQEVA